jgi:hypothetical protein
MADLVIRNALPMLNRQGTPVVERGVPTDRRPGRVLRGGA